MFDSMAVPYYDCTDMLKQWILARKEILWDNLVIKYMTDKVRKIMCAGTYLNTVFRTFHDNLMAMIVVFLFVW